MSHFVAISRCACKLIVCPDSRSKNSTVVLHQQVRENQHLGLHAKNQPVVHLYVCSQCTVCRSKHCSPCHLCMIISEWVSCVLGRLPVTSARSCWTLHIRGVHNCNHLCFSFVWMTYAGQRDCVLSGLLCGAQHVRNNYTAAAMPQDIRPVTQLRKARHCGY